MSSDINLSAAIRTSLITLQTTQTLINRTQNDLATGLKVNNAIDNPVAFFQAQALTDRAADFSNKKDGIDQGISSLSTALEGVTGIQNVVGQLQGLVISAESAPSTQIQGLVVQYNQLRSQVDSLATDTSYQGLNLIAGTGSILTVSFSTLTASNLVVNSVDVTAGSLGLKVPTVSTGTLSTTAAKPGFFKDSGFQLSWLTTTGGKALSQGALTNNTFYWSGTASHFSHTGQVSFHYGSVLLTITISAKLTATVAGGTATFTLTQMFHEGEKIQLRIASVVGSAHAFNASAGVPGLVYAGTKSGAFLSAAKIKFASITGDIVLNSQTPEVTQILLDHLQTNLMTLRAQAQSIGSNVALLNTRLDFTNNYVNLLQQGGGKLTLADLNEEGADLLSLQTRQQLGIQALSFAGQNEKAVLQLFR